MVGPAQHCHAGGPPNFFSITTRQTIRRGAFTSVAKLTAAFGIYIDGWNDNA